jgi:hypothetical protein
VEIYEDSCTKQSGQKWTYREEEYLWWNKDGFFCGLVYYAILTLLVTQNQFGRINVSGRILRDVESSILGQFHPCADKYSYKLHKCKHSISAS